MSSQNVNHSIQRAQNWLNLYNDKLDKKFGGTLTSSKDRARYWRFILRGLDTVQSDEDPVTRLIAVVGVAKFADSAGMLPPGASARMMQRAGEGAGVNVYAPSPTGRDDVDDARIPRTITQAIDFLPGVDDSGVSPLAVDVREYLRDNVYMTLMNSNRNIGNWVHGSGGELDYWEKDLCDLADELALKLGLTSKEREEAGRAAAVEAAEREERTNASMLNFLQTLQQMGLPEDPEEMQRIFAQSQA